MKIARFNDYFLINEQYLNTLTSSYRGKTYKFHFHIGHHGNSRRLRAEDVGKFSKITDAEINRFIRYYVSRIAEAIGVLDIMHGETFVIRSINLNLSMPIIATEIDDYEWNMFIKTVFRERPDANLKTGRNQLIIERSDVKI